LSSMGSGFDSNCDAMMPPKKIPNTKKRFHISFFQSYLKNGTFAGTQAAHTCRNEELIPNYLLPMISKVGTFSPINGPATYHGQGCLIQSMNVMFIFLLR
jgi:hypothetical protein